MAKEAKRVLAKEAEVESEKYAFRCFLLRLGFIGYDSKAARKILLRNLSGHSAFRNKAEEEKFKANQKANFGLFLQKMRNKYGEDILDDYEAANDRWAFSHYTPAE